MRNSSRKWETAARPLNSQHALYVLFTCYWWEALYLTGSMPSQQAICLILNFFYHHNPCWVNCLTRTLPHCLFKGVISCREWRSLTSIGQGIDPQHRVCSCMYEFVLVSSIYCVILRSYFITTRGNYAREVIWIIYLKDSRAISFNANHFVISVTCHQMILTYTHISKS